jgi:transcriptional regulator with PAS, ATPase and Fis domain
MVVDGRFRRDLFYRLNVARITLPPLRERLEDIDELTRHYVHHFGRAFDRAAVCSERVLELFHTHRWPGNIRELRNVVEAAFLVLDSAVIEPRHLPADFVSTVGGAPGIEFDSERTRVLETLRACKGNKSQAAASLRWSRMRLYRQLARYERSRTVV